MKIWQLLKPVLLACMFIFGLIGQTKADLLLEARIAYSEGKYAEAAEMFTSLAEQGNADAQVRLGVIKEIGKGIPQNFSEAAKWYRLAAEQGDATGQNLLGLMYEEGKGVPRNFVLAHMWINIAAANSSIGPRGEYVEARDSIAAHMTAKQIAEAQALASKCTKNKFKGC